jgi:hypothetical protein
VSVPKGISEVPDPHMAGAQQKRAGQVSGGVRCHFSAAFPEITLDGSKIAFRRHDFLLTALLLLN